jgi:prolyl oligopeptidase
MKGLSMLRSMTTYLFLLGFSAAAFGAGGPNLGDMDPYLWLSDIHGAKAASWAKAQTDRSNALLKADPTYRIAYDAILKSLDVRDRIPLVVLDHGDAYNFWQDGTHVRGIWRRTSIADYASPAPRWKILIDLDALDAQEHVPFVWQGADCAPSRDRCLISLSPGGGDATIVREFDLKTSSFVKDGFSLPLSKLHVTWLDGDTLLVATDFGPGSMTKSSYPRIVKLWHRGQPLTAAKTVYQAGSSDISAQPDVFHGPYGTIALIERGISFFTSEYFYLRRDNSTVKLPLPRGAVLRGVTDGQLIFSLRDGWTAPGGRRFPQGALVAFDVKPFVDGHDGPKFGLLYVPGATSTVEDVGAGRDTVYAAIFENIVGTVHAFKRRADGTWSDTKLALPGGGSTGISATNVWGPQAQFTFESYLKPPTLYATDGTSPPKAIKEQRPVFDASNLAADQYWATSKDGTKVPYYLIHSKDQHGPVPTILYSYGGFEVSLFPIYWNDGHRPLAGWAWVNRGGALAIANIRGGGEFGPAWHEAALKEHRQRAFDDFASVAKDLQARGFTTPKQTGIVGASNGGVLTTVTMTQHADLLGAVVSQRPLVDMLRYTRFGAGASWVDEYGDPLIPAQRVYLARYSAYQNVKSDVKYPPILFITETSDDRVTPIWARMMAAKMEGQGHDVLFNESTEGGHGPGATNAAQAEMWGLTYAFFAQKLGLR